MKKVSILITGADAWFVGLIIAGCFGWSDSVDCF